METDGARPLGSSSVVSQGNWLPNASWILLIILRHLCAVKRVQFDDPQLRLKLLIWQALEGLMIAPFLYFMVSKCDAVS